MENMSDFILENLVWNEDHLSWVSDAGLEMDDSDSSNASNDRTIAQNDNVNIRNVSDTTSMSSDIIDEVIVKINIETGMTNMDDLHEIIHRFHEHDIDNVTRARYRQWARACNGRRGSQCL